MSEDNQQENGAANGDVPEIELIIKCEMSEDRYLEENRNELSNLSQVYQQDDTPNINPDSNLILTSLQEIKTILGATMQQNKELIEQNNKLKRDNKTLMQHFTKEFTELKTTLEKVVDVLKIKRNMFDLLPPFPLESADSVVRFEANLKRKEVRSQLFQKFCQNGSDDIYRSVRNNLICIFGGDEVAVKFSWTAANGNISVKDFTMIEVIKEACMYNLPQAKNKNIESEIKKFLNGAKDRLAKSRKRKAHRAPEHNPKIKKEVGE